MIADQAQKLRGLMQPTPKARTIAVASGKGGVGKSCISLNIAVLLAEAGKRVVLVDADLSLANLDVMLGVDAPMDLSRVMSGANRIEELVIDLPCGVRFVPGASGLAQEEQFERIDLAGELTVLENDSDVIIVDCGAGISSQVLSFAHAADSTLVITTPEPTAITDAYALIKVLTRGGYRRELSLVVNQAIDHLDARRTYLRIANVARRFLGTRVNDGGYVPADVNMAKSVRRRRPVVMDYPKSPSSRHLAVVADKCLADKAVTCSRSGFFQRVLNFTGKKNLKNLEKRTKRYKFNGNSGRLHKMGSI